MTDLEPPAKKTKTTSDTDRRLYNSLPCFDLEELYTPEIVTIKVTSNQHRDDEVHTFTIARELICANSAYFTGVFKGGFQEGKSVVTTVEDTDYKVFACFVNFLYTRRIASYYDWNSTEAHSNNPAMWDFSTLFALYIFADKYDSKSFRMAVFEKIQRRMTDDFFPRPPTIKLMCESLLPSSPLYRFVVHGRLDLRETADELQRNPAAFLAECLVQSMRRFRAMTCDRCGPMGSHSPAMECRSSTHSMVDRKDAWSPHQGCQFHEHDFGRERQSCELRSQANCLLAEDDSTEASGTDDG